MAIKIALDAMGGDKAPQATVAGAVRALRNHGGELAVILVGDEEQIKSELRKIEGAEALSIPVVHTPEWISMHDTPAQAVKTKTNSSVHIGLGAQKQGKADAFVSAGNTGAVMGAAQFILGRQEGVSRPTGIGYYPTLKGFSLLIDVGTNVDCKPEHLVQFAQMGTIYAREVLKRENPSVGLINVGTEPGKGNEQAKATFELLQQAHDINFIGNIEGRDVMEHAADIILCDGFVGNIMLKLGESMAISFMTMVRREMERRAMPAEEQGLVGGVLKGVSKRFDYEEYGGAPLLGVNGNVIIGHGSSSERGIEKMIETALEMVQQDVRGTIASTLNV